MIIQDLKTSQIKKGLKANRCKFRYHNKNKSGGNFGINIIFSEFGKEDYKNFEISGNYDKGGLLYGLSVGLAYQIGFKVDVANMEELILKLKEMIKETDEEVKNKALSFMEIKK